MEVCDFPVSCREGPMGVVVGCNPTPGGVSLRWTSSPVLTSTKSGKLRHRGTTTCPGSRGLWAVELCPSQASNGKSICSDGAPHRPARTVSHYCVLPPLTLSASEAT